MSHQEKRPAIPAELRRLVLVQAGHRCAIHTCRHPEVDVHHISPWARDRQHRFENLIALCPNCHRRADAGEIDRKALRMYKARLEAAFRLEEVSLYPLEAEVAPRFGWIDSAARWRTLVLRDSDPAHHFEAEIEYPEFSLRLPGARRLNALVEKTVNGLLDRFRNTKVYSPDLTQLEPRFQLNCSFGVALLAAELASVRLTPRAYAGGAHGSQWTVPLNCSLEPFAELQLADLFADLSLGLTLLSEYSIQALLAPSTKHPTRDEDSVRRGAAAEAENFAAVNLGSEGLLVTFDEYQVGCYAEGPTEVLVPYAALGAALSPRVRGTKAVLSSIPLD